MVDDVLITGMGVVSPIGTTASAFSKGLREGRAGGAPAVGLDTSELPRRIACQIDEPLTGGDDMGRAARLAVMATREAISDARLAPIDLPPARVATIVGTTMGETEFIEDRLGADEADWLDTGHVANILKGQPGSISRHVQRDLGIGGSAMDLYGACAAGNMAITLARRKLMADQCDVVLAGGADGFSRLAFIGFMRLRVMSEGVCRPFDENRDGLLVGEGSAMFVLERASRVRARGVTARACVAGGAITCESYHPTRPDPNGDGLTRAIRSALAEARLGPDDVDYVCAHGTGTPQNDAIEMKVMHNCFNEGTPFSSIKALTGHTMGAAAAMEAACCVLSLQRQELIPTWHLANVLEPCAMDPVTDRVRESRVDCVVNNSAGFGGYNSSIVLTRT